MYHKVTDNPLGQKAKNFINQNRHTRKLKEGVMSALAISWSFSYSLSWQTLTKFLHSNKKFSNPILVDLVLWKSMWIIILFLNSKFDVTRLVDSLLFKYPSE